MPALAANRLSWTVEYGRSPQEWHSPDANLSARRCLAFAAQDRHQTPPAAVAVQMTHRPVAFSRSYLFFAAFTV